MDLEYLKLEALKLAYETAHKLGLFGFPGSYKNNFSLLKEDIEDIFKIADINMEYLTKNEKGAFTESNSDIENQTLPLKSSQHAQKIPKEVKTRFKNMSVKEAALKYLSESNKPCRVKEIGEAIYSGGVKAHPKFKGTAVNVALSLLEKKGEVRR